MAQSTNPVDACGFSQPTVYKASHTALPPMSWKRSKFATSFMNLFVEPRLTNKPSDRVQAIRQAMHDCLNYLPASPEQTRLWARVLYAPDVQALWYLRSDVMTLLAQPMGETAAKRHLSEITTLFNGLLPAAQKSRTARIRR